MTSDSASEKPQQPSLGADPAAGPAGSPPPGGWPGAGYPLPPGYPQGGYPALGPVPLSPQDERLWATLAHVGGLVVPFASLIVFLVFKERSPFVRAHALEALNFHISLWIYELVAFVAAIVLLIPTAGAAFLVMFPVLIVGSVLALVAMIQAAVAGNSGRPYRYPLIVRLVH